MPRPGSLRRASGPRDIVTPAVAPQRVRRGDGDGRLDQRRAPRRRRSPAPPASTSGPTSSASRSSTSSRASCPCSSTCGRSASTRWSTSTRSAASQVVVKELLDAGALDGSALTCTGETLAEQVARLDPPGARRRRVHAVRAAVQAHRRAAAAAWQPRARWRRHPQGGGRRGRHRRRPVHRSRACVRRRARARSPRSRTSPDSFGDGDIVVVRYEGPRGAPGMPEMLDPTSRITALCRAAGHHGRAHDRRPVLGRLGRSRRSGTSRPRRSSAVRSRWSRTATPSSSTSNTDRLDCRELDDPATLRRRACVSGRRPWPPTVVPTRPHRWSPAGCCSGSAPPRAPRSAAPA